MADTYPTTSDVLAEVLSDQKKDPVSEADAVDALEKGMALLPTAARLMHWSGAGGVPSKAAPRVVAGKPGMPGDPLACARLPVGLPRIRDPKIEGEILDWAKEVSAAMPDLLSRLALVVRKPPATSKGAATLVVSPSLAATASWGFAMLRDLTRPEPGGALDRSLSEAQANLRADLARIEETRVAASASTPEKDDPDA